MRILIPFTMLIPVAMAIISTDLWNGRDCTGTRASANAALTKCTRLNIDIYSGLTTSHSFNDCLFTYYGANCEDETLVAIQKKESPCGNYWGTVRSIKAAAC